MKFGTASRCLLACAFLSTAQANLRRRIQLDTTQSSTTTATTTSNTDDTSGSTTTDTSGSTSGTWPDLNTNTAGETTAGSTSSNNDSTESTSGGSAPVRPLQGHIGGGTFGDEDIRVLNNIGYAFVGYDLIKGNPLDTSGLVRIDLGFRNAIFQTHEYELMVDREYYVPSNLNVLECEGCNMHATTRVLESMSDYVDSLRSKVHANGSHRHGPTTGAFSGSFDFQQANRMMGQEHETSTESEISCCVYQAELSSYDLPPYSRNFQRAVERLRAAADTEDAQRRKLQEEETDASPVTEGEYTVPVEQANIVMGLLEEEIERFVHEFGTHYVKKVTMGSLYGEQTFISAEKRREMDQDGLDIRVAASVSVATSSGSGGVGLDMNVEDTQTFLSKTSQKSVYARGAKPVGDGDADEWLAYSSDNPVPTYIEVEPIEELDIYQNERVVEALSSYIASYCSRLAGASCESYSEGEHLTGPSGSSGGSSTSGGFSPDMNQPSLRQPSREPFVDNENYALDSTELFTGIAGSFEDGRRTYSAIVSDLGAGHSHQTFEIRSQSGDAWSGWSSWTNADFTCGENEAVLGLRSSMANFDSDRMWGINCGPVQGMDILSTRLGPDGLSMVDASDVDPFPWDNPLQEDFRFDCPLNHVVVGIHNHHFYDLNDDRWKVKCALMVPAARLRQVNAVSITPTWNRFEESFYYSSPSRAVLKGLLGDFNPDVDDTSFRFAETWLDANSATVGSAWSEDWVLPDDLSTEEGPPFDCGGRALTGVRSSYDKDATTGFARNFGFECRGVQNHRLVHADGRTATASTTPTEADWSTPGFEGRGASFGLECPGSKILAGLQMVYDEAHNDLGWRALCLALVAN